MRDGGEKSLREPLVGEKIEISKKRSSKIFGDIRRKKVSSYEI